MCNERKGSLLYCFDVGGAVSLLQTFRRFIQVHLFYFKTWIESMRLFSIFVVDYKSTEKSIITYEEIKSENQISKKK